MRLLFAAAVLCCLSAARAQTADRQAMADYLAAWESLPMVERSDWLNVKTDVEPAAVGDGLADDTAALQAACASITDRQPPSRILYFPPGTYRITDSLVLTQVQGGALIGHGGATRIVWDGPEGGRMVHSNGFGRSRYVGMSFDGRGKAAVGVDHDSKTYYETRVRYQYCAFRNFTESGIRVGHDQKVASAEMMFMDCRFEQCRRGISFLQFNDYDNSIQRCVFQDCGSAIHCFRGNVYVRDCHFENSREEDVLLPPHSHSIRRCTSVGGNAFVRPAQEGAHSFLLAVQDCQVTGWKDPLGAIQAVNRGPVLIFDSSFAAPADAGSPAVSLRNGKQWESTLILANVQTRGLAKAVDPGVNAKIVEVPRAAGGALVEAHGAARWRHRPAIPVKVFDAKADFGATGNGSTDDTQAIRQTIAAARKHGQGAVAYLPVGNYRIVETIAVPAGDYTVGGTLGFRTSLDWGGPAGGAMLHADDAAGVTIEQLRFNAPKEMTAISLLVTASGPGRLVVDGVYVGGGWQPEFAGLVLRDLPAGFRVEAPHVDGDTRILNSGRARILIDNWYAGYAGPMVIAGQAGEGGFLGINSAVASHGDPDLTVADNGSVVIGDFYTEQTKCHLIARGQPGQAPGRITISNAKVGCETPEKIRIEGYSGQVTVSRANLLYFPTRLAGQGGANAMLLLLGNAFHPGAPAIDLQQVELLQVGCLVWNYEDRSLNQPLPDTPGAEAAINRALDHFRELSLANLVD